MQKRKSYKAKDKLITSKAMASMRETAWGKDAVISLHRLEVKLAARDDAQVMAAAEAKRQRKAEKLRRQFERNSHAV